MLHYCTRTYVWWLGADGNVGISNLMMIMDCDFMSVSRRRGQEKKKICGELRMMVWSELVGV